MGHGPQTNSSILYVVSFTTNLTHQKLKPRSTCFDPINISVPNIMGFIGTFLVTKVFSTGQKQSHVDIAKLLKFRAFDLGEIQGSLKPSEKLNDNLNYFLSPRRCPSCVFNRSSEIAKAVYLRRAFQNHFGISLSGFIRNVCHLHCPLNGAECDQAAFPCRS